MAMNMEAVLKLTAKVVGQENVEKLQQSIGGLDKAAGAAKRSFKDVVSSSAFQAAAVAAAGIGVALGTSVNAAIQFESAMADVRKVVPGLDDAAALREMEGAIIDLSRRLPISAEGFAQIIAAAGQSGIARDELIGFAESAAQMAVAFDMTADQAGVAMAKLRTSMGLSQPEVVDLADAMNHLSNNMASTAPEVTDFMLRVGALGQQVAMTEEQTAALGSAMIAAGAEPEVAATSFRNLIRALTMGDSATARQSEAMERLGLTTTEVAEAMQRDAVGTMRDVFQRLAALPADIRIPTVSAIFGEEVRALRPLLTNLGLFDKALGLVADKSQFTGSMLAEFETRSGTTANQIQLLKNNVLALQIAIGQTLLPALSAIVLAITPIAMGISQAATRFPLLTTAIVMLTGALAALVLALPFIASFLSILTSLGAAGITFGAVGAAIGGVAATLAGWAGAVMPVLALVGGALKAIGAVLLGVFTGPVGWVALLAAAAAALLIFREPIGAFFQWIVDKLTEWIASLWEWGAPVREFWVGLWESVKEIIAEFFGWLGQSLYDLFVQPWITLGATLLEAFTGIWESIKVPVLAFFEWWGTTMYQLLIAPWIVAWNLVAGLAGQAWERVKAVALAFWNWYVTAVQQYIAEPFVQGVAAVMATMSALWEGLKSIGATYWAWLQQQIDLYLVQPFIAARDTVAGVWGGIVEAVGSTWGLIGDLIEAKITAPIQLAWSMLMNWMQERVAQARDGMVSAFTGVVDGIKNVFRSTIVFVAHAVNSWIGIINRMIGALNMVRSAAGLSPLIEAPTVSIPQFAKGGFVNRPTLGVIGEGGEPEYIIPASKMGAAAQNFLGGARGASVLGASSVGSGPVSINVNTGPVLEQDGQRYVSIDDLEGAMRSTANQIYATLRTPAGRRAIGVA